MSSSEPGARTGTGAAGTALLRECYADFRQRLHDLIRASLEQMGDLFETGSPLPDAQAQAFRQKRDEWLARFDAQQDELFEQRLAGQRRKGRRPDADASLSSLRVLTPFDHDKQAALLEASQFLLRFTHRELSALDLRVETLLPDARRRDVDNPLAVTYLLDAIGASARATYPDPKIWRPFMERLVADLTPAVNRLYVAANRRLADAGVLPEIKAALRARSDLRPDDDDDLLPTFKRMLHEANKTIPDNVVVPDLGPTSGGAPALDFGARRRPDANLVAGTLLPAGRPGGGFEMSAAQIMAGLAALASRTEPAARGSSAAPGFGAGGPMPASGGTVPPAGGAFDFPDLDPLMALGSSASMFATLAQWQRLDLPAALARSLPAGPDSEGLHVPMNLVPHLRAAIESQISNEGDRITMDVIALLFDYVFRDPSIPPELRVLFGRLQVPIVKAALLDRGFFSNRAHPARRLLDRLAEAAVGAASDPTYRDAFSTKAEAVVAAICADFEFDTAVFASADAQLAAFVDAEQQARADTVANNVAQALAAEAEDSDRAKVRALLRDRLAGSEVPFTVRSFVESVWADHMTELRHQKGVDSLESLAADQLVDDLLWSIEVKDRAGQKTRLTRLIPQLIGGLRRACVAQAVAPERSKAFFDELYTLHMAAMKPVVAGAVASPVTSAAAASTTSTAGGATSTTSVAPNVAVIALTAKDPKPTAIPPENVHDYVGEMAVGTWLVFTTDHGKVYGRLTWVSPLRTKYIFTSRSRTQALVYTPEELAYALGAGGAALVVEPVPLFDRAVSAALDTLAARTPPAAAKAAA